MSLPYEKLGLFYLGRRYDLPRDRPLAEPLLQQKMQTAVSMGAAVIGALIGRKAVSMSTLGRATTAARGVSRASKEREDVARAETKARDAQAALEELEHQAASEIDALTASLTPDSEPIDAVDIKPTRGGVGAARRPRVGAVSGPSAWLRTGPSTWLRASLTWTDAGRPRGGVPHESCARAAR